MIISFYGTLKSTGGMQSKWDRIKMLSVFGKRRQKKKDCILVFPSTWQRVMPGFRCHTERIQPENLKEFLMTGMIRNTRTCIIPKRNPVIPDGLLRTMNG